MSDKMSMWINGIAAAIGAVTAALPQIYSTGLPDWAEVVMQLGGVVVAVLGSMKAGKSFKSIRAVDVDGDGTTDQIVVDLEKKE